MIVDGRGGCLPRSARLVSPKDFRRVRRAGRRGGRARGQGFVVFAAPAGDPAGDRVSEAGSGPERVKLGVAVARRVGKAVVRNRVKRRIREWFRSYRADALRRGREAIDLVVIARTFAPEMSWRGVRAELCTLAERAVAQCGSEEGPVRRQSGSR